MTDIHKNAKQLPVKYSASQSFEILYSQLNMHERINKGHMHDISVALADRAFEQGEAVGIAKCQHALENIWEHK